jgi:hypothetical protein
MDVGPLDRSPSRTRFEHEDKIWRSQDGFREIDLLLPLIVARPIIVTFEQSQVLASAYTQRFLHITHSAEVPTSQERNDSPRYRPKKFHENLARTNG